MAEDKNRHVRDYLSYYLGLPHSPHYAVMINGPWGIGKTHLVTQFLKTTIKDPDKFVYVSLFGLTSLDEIDAALLEATYPLLASKAAKVTGRIIKAALKFKHIDLDLNVHELVDKFNPRIFVFDDLERCEMSVNVVMGYINEFVEHEHCKVIIIANEDEILGKSRVGDEETRDQRQRAEYRRRREKIIGKTLEVQSAFDEAFAFFISKIDHPETRTIILNNAAEIAAIYTQSKLNNLRILQQTMWDF
jgi:Cdc6-like AAA superfamily ATPase